MYETTVTPIGDNLIEVRAYGGTRQQRGAKITAALRQYRPRRTLIRRSVSYDEAYGFAPCTTARYWVE